MMGTSNAAQQVVAYESDGESGRWLVVVPAGTDLAKLTGLPSVRTWTRRKEFKLDGTPRIATPTDAEIREDIAKRGFCAFKAKTEFIEK
jgi:hypothetical protein